MNPHKKNYEIQFLNNLPLKDDIEKEKKRKEIMLLEGEIEKQIYSITKRLKKMTWSTRINLPNWRLSHEIMITL